MHLKDAIWRLFSYGSNNDLSVFTRFHLSILNHLVESSPYKSPAKNIFNAVEVFWEKLQGYWINDILHKCVILKVKQDCLITVRSIIGCLIDGLREDKSLNNIYLVVLFEQANFNFMWS